MGGKNISAIILSAGKSERMGTPKFALRLGPGLTFLEKLTEVYRTFGCDEIIAVVNPHGAELLNRLGLRVPPPARVIVNHRPEWGRFYSLKLAALALERPSPVFVSNVDNPLLAQQTLASLHRHIGSSDYVSPCFKGKGGHPFLISAGAVNDLRGERHNQLHLKQFLKKYTKSQVEVGDERVLLNINTAEEYRQFTTP